MICVNKGKIKNLTVGKKYTVIRVNSGVHYGSNIPYKGYYVINDAGIQKHYSSKRFIDMSEWREKQINELIHGTTDND